ncbi:MAG: hypothetical protein KJ646_01850 [Nanoarchaeota archaeon]|nr:hypothetical protein [Nanoarchaeota archaeon]MBU4116827.1 hypothetical protein [Nanoarchaeota archaeon]MBU4580789.1 hypothetical protein [Patescibacteria group bacterium]
MKKEDIKSKIPQIKKKIHAFLVGEEGKISKQSLLKTGLVLGGIALGAATSQSVSAGNTLTLNYASGTATGTHANY